MAELAPKGDRRMGANPHANGGILLRDLRMPDFHVHAVTVPSPGAVNGQDTLVLGKFLATWLSSIRISVTSESSVRMRHSRISWRGL